MDRARPTCTYRPLLPRCTPDTVRIVVRNVVRLDFRSIRTAFRRWNDPGLEVVWHFALASMVGIVLALIAMINALSSVDEIVPGLLAAAGMLAISAATGAYVVYAVRRPSLTDEDEAAPPD